MEVLKTKYLKAMPTLNFTENNFPFHFFLIKNLQTVFRQNVMRLIYYFYSNLFSEIS